MLSVPIGARYSDPEGEWEVVGRQDDMVEIECVQEENLNFGKTFLVPELEAVIGYYKWDQIVEYMDDEIREDLNYWMAPCTEIEFLEAYLKAHKEKFGKDLEL